MEKRNSVFIATSLDGYIADKNGGVDWLDTVPNPDQDDMGYLDFISGIDALVMGRNSFETVVGFDVEWPYEKPVFVLSNKLKSVPEKYKDKAFIVSGTLKEVLAQLHQKGFCRLYIDGGLTIQSFLKEDLIDDMVITTIPVLLGEGIPLFGQLDQMLRFKCTDTRIYLEQVVQNHYQRFSD